MDKSDTLVENMYSESSNIKNNDDSDNSKSVFKSNTHFNNINIFSILVLISMVVIAGSLFSMAFITFKGDNTSIDINELTVSNNVSSDQQVYNDSVNAVVTIYNDGNTQNAQGSGFITDDGYIITNEHVIADSDTIHIEYHSGEFREAFVIGEDNNSDIAVINSHGGHPDSAETLSFADEYAVGDDVIAIGSPSAYNKSLTTGTISGVDRAVEGVDNYSIPHMVQTDSALNPGNSGGPIVNMDGEVVAVAQSTLGENLGMGVSAELTQKVYKSFIDEGSVEYPLIGVQTSDINPIIADEIGVEPQSGVLVMDTLEDGPVDNKLQTTEFNQEDIETRGDIIVDIDGQDISNNQELSQFLILNYAPNDTVTLGVETNEGEYEQIEIQLDRR